VKNLVDDNSEPTVIAYAIGAAVAVVVTFAANVLMGWPLAWWLLPASVVLAILGVFMIETGCEALAILMLASIPLGFVLWYRPEYSLGKQLWLSALVAHGCGKLWVGLIR